MKENTKGWTKEEMEEGFLPEPEVTPPPARKWIDLRRRTDLAGGEEVQHVAGLGIYRVSYDELGYAVKASLEG